MRALLIINPISGDDEPNSAKVDRIQAVLAKAPFHPEVTYTTEEMTAAQIARKAVSDGVEVVLVGGGDGTVSEVARELVHTQTVLGIIPIGTFNNIARSLKIPAEIDGACQIISQYHVEKIDVGEANGTQIFFEAAGAGLDAQLFPLGEEMKDGHWTRLFQIFHTAFLFQAPHFRIVFGCKVAEATTPHQRRRYRSRELQSHSLERRALLVVAANGPYYGSGFTVSPGARLNDGKLTLSLYRNFGKWELLHHFISISRGKRRFSSKIETFSAAEIELQSTLPVPVHVDGVPFAQTPVKLKTLPGALRVLVSEK